MPHNDFVLKNSSISRRVYRIVFSAWRRRYTILLPILIFPIFGVLVSVTSTKQYKSHTSMLIQETAKMNPFLEDLAVSAMLKERMDALRTLLHSRHILQEVATELELLDESSTPVEVDRVIGQLSSSLSLKMMGKDLIRIEHNSDNKQGMERFLDSVTNHFIEQLLAPERSSISDSSEFLYQHLDEKRKELEQAEARLAQFKTKNAEALPEFQSMNITRLNKLKQKLSEKKSILAGTVKNVGGLKQLLNQTNPIIGKLEEQIIKIRSELTLLRARYKDKHSRVQAAQRALRRLENERVALIESTNTKMNSDQLWEIAMASPNSQDENQPILISQIENLQNAKSKADVLDEEILELTRMINELETEVKSYGDKEVTLIQLQRDLSVKRGLYDDLLKRYEMAQITGSLGRFEQAKRVKIIDRPFTPSAPSNLPLAIFVVAGLFGGVFLGIGIAIVKELSDARIRTKRDVELLTGVSVISRIPNFAGV